MPKSEATKIISGSLDHTVRSHFEILFRPQKLRFKAPNTVYRWRLELQRLDLFLERPALLTDLSDETVGDAGEWMLAATPGGGLGLSIESTRGFLGRVSKLWDFLARKRIVADFPTLENLRKQKRVPRAWTNEQLKILWDALQKQPGRFGGISASDWLCSLHSVLWCTGERIGALLKCRPEDIDLAAGFLILQPDDRKGRQVGRVYRLNPQSVEWLSRILIPCSGPSDPRSLSRELVWPWPYNYGYLWRRYREILRCAGLPNGRERMFHCMRKSHASHLEAAGGDATASLGHRDRQTTRDHYLDETISRKEWPADRLRELG